MEQVIDRMPSHRNTCEGIALSGPGGVFAEKAHRLAVCETQLPSDASVLGCSVQSKLSGNRHQHSSYEHSLAELALRCMDQETAGNRCAFAQDAALGTGWRSCPLLSLLCCELRSMADGRADVSPGER
jgi:hypothetical protein